MIGLAQPRQLSHLGTQPPGAGALGEDGWVLRVASPGGGPEHGHVVSSVLPA